MTLTDISWRLDPTSIVLLVLVAGIAAAVIPFAHRSLRGDRHGTGVTVAIAVMLASTALVAVSGALWMLALGWSIATAATLIALSLGGGRAAVGRAAAWLLVGDVALWVAVALDAAGTTSPLSAVLLVVAAVVRCALPPAHSWLVDSLYAPTPVSAALHGGIVNGGGILVITQFDIIAASPIAIGLLAVLSGTAIIMGTLAALVRGDIKGRLVASTSAQMGFMLLVAALGLTAAALLHLVAHGFYKSALFLSSSDGIDRRAAERRAPRRLLTTAAERQVRAVAGALVPAMSLTAVAIVIYPGGRGAGELLVLAAVATAFAAAGARSAVLAPSRWHVVALIAALAGAAALFSALTATLTGAIATTPRPDVPALPFVLTIALVVIVALCLFAGVRRWAPDSATALRLLALGHRWGASRRHGLRSRFTQGSPFVRRSARVALSHSESAPMGAPA